MNTLTIGSFNFQNKKANRLGIKIEGKDSAFLISEHIQRFNYDILGTQELTKRFRFRLSQYLKGYETTGKYRYINNILSKLIPKSIDFNESTSIITKIKVLDSKTKHLPSFFKIPRIVTIAHMEKNQEIFTIMNTHLEIKDKNTQIRQLQALVKIIKNDKYRENLVLMGDFNMSVNMEHFAIFLKNLEDLGLQRVEINERTQINRKRAIDHIFIPSHWIVVEKGCVNDQTLKAVTDHTGIYVKVKKSR